MKWIEFKGIVNGLLADDRRRIGIQTFLDTQIMLGVGDVQRLITYYRTGFSTTFETDDLTRDGFASRGELPAGINLREFYHVKAGRTLTLRPLYPYEFANRNDLRAGVVGLGNGGRHFRYTIDVRSGGRTFWAYPAVLPGYKLKAVWDSVAGRDKIAFLDGDEVPFDMPMANLVWLWVKAKLTRLVDRDASLSREFERDYRGGIASLYSECEERLHIKTVGSDASAATFDCVDPNVSSIIDLGSSVVSLHALAAAGCSSPSVANPTEWVMVGDSGDRSTLADTIAVATAIKALDPEFMVHLGDMSPGTTFRPIDAASGAPVGTSTGGSSHLIRDLFTRHYWSFADNDLYACFGDSDLSTGYGSPTLDALPNTRALIGNAARAANRLWYEFARGPVRFFVMNSGLSDSDANIQLSYQLQFLGDRAAVANEPWLVVVIHRPAYTSDETYHPGSTVTKTLTDQIRALGIDLVVSSHGRSYERFMDATGLQHVICGLGGSPRRPAKTVVSGDLGLVGSQIFFADKPGFMHFTADAETLQWEMLTTDNVVVDRYTLRKSDDVESIAGELPEIGLPPRITMEPSDRTVTQGNSVTFTVAAEGTAPLVYQWFKNGVSIPGAVNTSLTLTGVTQDSEGGYSVHVSNAYGSATSRTATLTVNEQSIIYTGRSVLTTIGETEVLALNQLLKSSVSGFYSFGEGSGYVYFVFPEALPAPTSIAIEPLPVVMAGADEGYDQTLNGIAFKLVTVSGTSFRLYRTYNQLHGSIFVRVQ